MPKQMIHFLDGSACSGVEFTHEQTADGRHLMHAARRVYCDDEDKLDTCDAAKFASEDGQRLEDMKRTVLDGMS